MQELGVRTVETDLGSEQDIERLFAITGKVSHIVTTAADVGGAYQPIAEYDVGSARGAVDSRLLGPLLLAKHGAPLLEPGGSIVFTSGIAAYRPGPRASLLAALNGALASLAAAIIALLRNGFITGTVLHADGGHRLA